MSGPQRPPLLALATFDNLRPGGVPVDELFQDLGGLGALRYSGWRITESAFSWRARMSCVDTG
jgi:hypothetical protein